MNWTVYLSFFCVLTVISGKNNKAKWPKSARQDPTESPIFKQEILSLMGLRQRPRPTITTPLRQLMSAPRYMMKLYNSISKNQSYGDGFCCNDTIVDTRALGADTIMSYLHPVYGQAPKISHYHAKFQFKVVTPSGEKVTATEFRLYKQRTPPNKFWQNSTYIVRLYQIIYPTQVLDLLETRVLRSWDVGWQTFDITRAGKAWSQSPSNNYGLELAVENWFNHEVSPYKAGFVGFHGPREFHPFIVSFFHQTGDAKYSKKFYSVIQRKKTSRVARSVNDGFGAEPRPLMFKSTNTEACKRHSMYVDFAKLQWLDWVIAPAGFSAYYCNGDCSFPLTTHMNATQHAIIQTLMNLITLQAVPKPCCAPTKLTSISFVYEEEDGLTIKHFDKMVATSCGCR